MASKFDISNLDREYRDLVGNAAYNNENVTVKNIVKDYSNKFDTLQVCFLSDPHIGSSDFDSKGLTETLMYADSQENAIIFLLGDGINSAILGSKSDIYEDLLTPGEQLDYYAKMVKLANGNSGLSSLLHRLEDNGKIVVVHSGNHEDRIQRQVGLSASKIAAELAGVGDAYAPFYANTDIVLRQPKSPDGKFHFGVVSHHGTGIRNIDGVFRLLRNVDNAHMCVIGHTHQYSQEGPVRLIRTNEKGEQVYHDVLYLTLPASGGGSYGAGMALPDIKKQTAVWVAVTSKKNPFANEISATGIKQPEFIPVYAFFTPTNVLNSSIKIKRYVQADSVISKIEEDYNDEVEKMVADTIQFIKKREQEMYDNVAKIIAEKKKLKEPKGFSEYVARTQKPTIEQVVKKLDKEPEEPENNEEERGK